MLASKQGGSWRILTVAVLLICSGNGVSALSLVESNESFGGSVAPATPNPGFGNVVTLMEGVNTFSGTLRGECLLNPPDNPVTFNPIYCNSATSTLDNGDFIEFEISDDLEVDSPTVSYSNFTTDFTTSNLGVTAAFWNFDGENYQPPNILAQLNSNAGATGMRSLFLIQPTNRLAFEISGLRTSGGFGLYSIDYTFSINATSVTATVPAPASLPMFLCAIAGLSLWRRRARFAD